jgi:hypothetical protein
MCTGEECVCSRRKLNCRHHRHPPPLSLLMSNVRNKFGKYSLTIFVWKTSDFVVLSKSPLEDSPLRTGEKVNKKSLVFLQSLPLASFCI